MATHAHPRTIFDDRFTQTPYCAIEIPALEVKKYRPTIASPRTEHVYKFEFLLLSKQTCFDINFGYVSYSKFRYRFVSKFHKTNHTICQLTLNYEEYFCILYKTSINKLKLIVIELF